MPEGKPVKLTPAKGRPMLNWVGKQPLDRVVAFPAQLVERFDPQSGGTSQEFPAYENWQDHPQGLLFYGDNKDVLACLLANGYRGKVNLIYIDPPFDSGANYVRSVELRGIKTSKIDGEQYSLGEQIQYSDIWANDNYLQFMYERLLLIKELLHETGSIFLHCDWRMIHRLRLVLDEVFSPENFINEIVWKHTVLGGTHGRRLPKSHETLLWYGKSQDYIFNDDAKSARVEFGDYIRKTLRQDEDGKWFYTRGRMSRQPSADELARKAFTRTYVDDPEAGTLASDVWDDLLAYRVYGDENTEYPTQKNESLIERCVELGSFGGDLVMDCFSGSGSTAAVAQKLGRRWIAADINKGAIQTTSKRLQKIIREQLAAPSHLPGMQSEDAPPPPAQLSFSLFRVNDYDLQIQHNEAVNLAMQHVGVERLKGDSFYDGTLGRRLVKIIPLQHPLTLLDLQLIQDELKTRSNESRDITVVCLGKETAVDPYLKDYNRKHPINKIEVIELRTDPRYGKFFSHQPAGAEIEITRQGDKAIVEIHDFISPTILERLEMDSGIFKAKITDWRSMVDTVLIDNHYDGEVFNIVLSDVPEHKNDLVAGRYELSAPSNPTVIAVKIIEMLGEEVIVTKEI